MGRSRRTVVVIAALVALVAATVGVGGAAAQPSTPAQAPGQGQGQNLDLYEATVDAEQYEQLLSGGYDVTHVEETADGFVVQLVLSPAQLNKLGRDGIELEPVLNADGLTAAEAAERQKRRGYKVYRPWDGPAGLEQKIRNAADEHPDIAEVHTLGQTHQGRDILAVRVTDGVADVAQGERPAVLYQGTTHAREWISTEVTRRTLNHFLDGATSDPVVQDILATTELWFVPVVNPDGYQFTFDAERLWRKNLRDNDGNGQIDGNDGVDLNRNYPEHWGYDEEGSSSQLSSETYRGPEPASEPEVAADISLFDMADFRFAISYHSYGNLLLYSQGWQTQTPSADDPIYVALTGSDADPAVAGYDPGPGADLYITNGEFTDWAHGTQGVLAWTPELDEGCTGCTFVFPDDPKLVQDEFKRNLPFALNVARSAATPDDPVSHMDISTEGLYLDVAEIDPWKTHHPSSDLKVDVSYGGGSSQPVEVLAKRSLGDVTLHYRVNGGDEVTAGTAPSPDGDVYGGNNAYATYYQYLRGEVPGLAVGDSVEYWFSGDGESTEHVSFDVVDDADADVLIVAHEDRTGAVNIPGYASTDPATPNYLDTYETAIADAGRSSDVWDVDAEGREAPDHLGVLSHYDAVVWYMGDNFVTRTAGRTGGNVDRLHNEMTLEARAYMNEGGKVLLTGQWAGALENGVAGTQLYDPVAGEACVEGGAIVLSRCLVLSDKNDVLQYWFGGYLYGSDGGTDDDGNPYPVSGVAAPYDGLAWELNGADSAQNQVHTGAIVTTSSLLKPDAFPQFESHAPAVWDRGAGGAFEPYDGDWYVYSDTSSISYKRLMRTVDLSGLSQGDDASMTFRYSYDTEPDWDFVFVEAHTVGEDDWTTLEVPGITSTDTGQSCPAGWFELHPTLERYQGADCSGTGADGGEWHAASGRSAGWEEWQVDLSAFAGSEVELSISYASDWAVQGLGAFVDHVELSTGSEVESFEGGLGDWTVAGPPEGSAPNANDWTRTESIGLEEGAAISTDRTLLFGFGLEGITGADTRATVMDRSLDHLLGP